MKNGLRALAVAAFALISACSESLGTSGQSPRILAMGDSMLAWNALSQQSVTHFVEQSLGEPIVDRSVNGARMIYALPVSGALGLNITKQYIAGDWDWVIVNGGGNDLWLGCGCVACDRKMDRMISADGASGVIFDLVQDLRRGGTKVLYLGYLRTPGKGSPIDHCAKDGNVFEGRLAEMASRDEGVYFLPLKDIVPNNDLSFHDFDRIHPSAKGSAAIGERVAALIRSRD